MRLPWWWRILFGATALWASGRSRCRGLRYIHRWIVYSSGTRRQLLKFFAVVWVIYEWRLARARNRFRSLRGRTVLLHGTGGRLGRCLALECAQRGATVIVVDVNEQSAVEVAAAIHRRQGRAFSISCDTSDVNAIQRKLIASIDRMIADKLMAPVDVCIDVNCNPPREGERAPLHMLHRSQIEDEFKVSILSHFWVAQAFLPRFIQRGRGKLVIVSSSASTCGQPDLVHFTASQFAALGMTEALRLELAAHGYSISVLWACVHLTMLGRPPVDSASDVTANLLCPTYDLDIAAQRVVDSIEQNESVCHVPTRLRIVWILRALLDARAFGLVCSLLGLTGSSSITPAIVPRVERETSSETK